MAAAILEVLAGQRLASDAAAALQVSLPRYYQLEQRALAGLVTACEPRPRGPIDSPQRRIARLQQELSRCQRDCSRHQALARAAQRAIGLPPRAALARLEPQPMGRPPRSSQADPQQTAELEREIQRLKLQLQASQVREQIARTMPHLAGRRPHGTGPKKKRPKRRAT